MSQRDIRSHKQKEQDERRLSLQRSNAYFTFVSETPVIKEPSSTNAVNEPKPADFERPRSCSPMLMSAPYDLKVSQHDSLLCSHAPTPVSSVATSTVTSLSIASAPTACTTTTSVLCPTTTTVITSAVPNSPLSLASAINKNESKHEAQPNQPRKEQLVQTGIDRYIKSKRKLSPQNKGSGNKPKVNRSNAATGEPLGESSNRFALLDNTPANQIDVSANVTKKVKPPPIYLREKTTTALVNKLVALIGENNFHVIPLTKGNISETKIQTQTESSHRDVTKYLDDAKKSYYTYQLKSAKGLQVVIKGIESTVKTDEIIAALKTKNFNAKSVINIMNKNKEPQPLFKVELEPEGIALKRNSQEVHPIYKLQFLLHRRITVEQPHKRNQPVQCTNCQEYGHTRAYCTLRSICVVCSDPHSTANCPKNKEDISVKLCSNCGENHTANWRGCPVFKDLKNRLYNRAPSSRNLPSRSHTFVAASSNRATTSLAPSQPVLRTDPSVSFASALKSGSKPPPASTDVPRNFQPANKISNDQQHTQNPPASIEALMTSLQQSLEKFMDFMQATLQELLRNQNTLIQLIVSTKSV